MTAQSRHDAKVNSYQTTRHKEADQFESDFVSMSAEARIEMLRALYEKARKTTLHANIIRSSYELSSADEAFLSNFMQQTYHDTESMLLQHDIFFTAVADTIQSRRRHQNTVFTKRADQPKPEKLIAELRLALFKFDQAELARLNLEYRLHPEFVEAVMHTISQQSVPENSFAKLLYSRLLTKRDILHKCREVFVLSMLPFVLHIVRQSAAHATQFMTSADIISVGSIGLSRAACRYHFQRGRFRTYAGPWVIQTLNRELERYRFIRLPSYRLSGPGRDEKILAETAVASYDAILASLNQFFDLDSSALCGVDTETPEDAYSLKENQVWIRQLIADVLTAREEEIILRRFGFTPYHPESLEAIGRSIGITRERVRQIESAALKKLHKRLVATNIRFCDHVHQSTLENLATPLYNVARERV